MDESLTVAALFGAQRRGRVNHRGFERGHDARQARDRPERQRRRRERRAIMRLYAVEQTCNQSSGGYHLLAMDRLKPRLDDQLTANSYEV
jgi:hypothetical protein